MTKTDERIDPVFRNGSLTAVSVVLGFSLSFLSRWAGLEGRWHIGDLFAVSMIAIGIAVQIYAMASMLWIGSLKLTSYNRSIKIFLVGVTLIALGVAVAIVGDVTGYGQHVLGG